MLVIPRERERPRNPGRYAVVAAPATTARHQDSSPSLGMTRSVIPRERERVACHSEGASATEESWAIRGSGHIGHYRPPPGFLAFARNDKECHSEGAPRILVIPRERQRPRNPGRYAVAAAPATTARHQDSSPSLGMTRSVIPRERERVACHSEGASATEESWAIRGSGCAGHYRPPPGFLAFARNDKECHSEGARAGCLSFRGSASDRGILGDTR